MRASAIRRHAHAEFSPVYCATHIFMLCAAARRKMSSHDAAQLIIITPEKCCHRMRKEKAAEEILPLRRHAIFTLIFLPESWLPFPHHFR